MSETRSTWWAETRATARKGAIGTLAITMALSGIGYFVWTSPSGPTALAKSLGRVLDADPAVAKLKADRDKLNAKIVGLREQIAKRDALLAAKYSGTGPLSSGTTASTAQTVLLKTRVVTVHTSSGSGSGSSGSSSKPTSTPKPTPTPSPTASPIVTPTRTQLVSNSNRVFGLYTEQAPFNWAEFDDATSKLGYTPQAVGYFTGWDQTFRADVVARAWKHGQVPIMTWESRPIAAANNVVNEPDYSLSKIIDGSFDSYLHTYAKAIVAEGLPLGIRLDHEMNATWYPWAEDDGHGNSINGNSAGQYVQMWRHVHDIFQEEGANKYVYWIWSPNVINNLTSTHKTVAYLQSLYPGDDYVDWVGMSGYLRPPYKTDQTFTFDYTFAPTIAQLRQVAPGKRILLSEIGASETGGHKVAWINSLFQALADPANSDIAGLLWFDESVTTYIDGVLGTNDWRVDSRPETLSAFKAALATNTSGFGSLPTP